MCHTSRWKNNWERCAINLNMKVVSAIIGFHPTLIESLSRLMSNCENIQVKAGDKHETMREIFKFRS